LIKGGAESKTRSTVAGIDGCEFTVGYGASYDQEPLEWYEAKDIETVQFPLVRHYNPLTALPAVISVARYLRRNDFDIVHTHSTEAGIVGRIAAAIADVPHVVHTVHGVPFTDDRNNSLNRFVLACERTAARYTDRMVTNADAIADEYLQRGIGSPEQYTTVYSGIDLAAFRDAVPATGLPGSRPRIVMVSRLADGKGFGVLLDAAELVADGDGSVLIVGDGPLFEELSEEISNRGLEDTVFLAGYRDDVPNVLAASDILVLPSFREGTPRVISEAMASGLPVVGTDIAGIPEQIDDGESGFLIPTGDPEALAERLDRLLSDPELRKLMGARGQELAEGFSDEAMCDALDDIYRELLAEADGGA
jgi:glycosyltransferase involved in cell wall biosynthesis